MKQLLGIEVTDEEFDRLFCEQANGKELKVIDGKVVAIEHEITEKELKIQRIAELKEKLRNSDYKALKFMEGALTPIDYAPIKEQRNAWRAEINDLEKQIR